MEFRWQVERLTDRLDYADPGPGGPLPRAQRDGFQRIAIHRLQETAVLHHVLVSSSVFHDLEGLN